MKINGKSFGEEIKLINYAKEQILMDNTKKIIISDYQILPSIVGLKTTAPNKWFDILSTPTQNNKFFQSYKKFFLSCKNNGVITGGHEHYSGGNFYCGIGDTLVYVNHYNTNMLASVIEVNITER